MPDITLSPVDHDPFRLNLVPVDYIPFVDAVPALPERPSASQQWEGAIEEQRQRDLRKPSMGQQIGDIVTGTAGMFAAPVLNQAKRMQEAYERGIDWEDPERVKELSGGTFMDVLRLGVPGAAGAEAGAVGALGGRPPAAALKAPATAATQAEKMLARRAAPEISHASRNASIYNPPAKNPRPFEADYPQGASSDAAGKLLTDIEGRPLTAEVVAGRRTVGSADTALTPDELYAAAEKIAGARIESRAPRILSGNAGVFRISQDMAGHPHYNISVSRSLPPAQQDMVAGHEVGHAIDYFAGIIPADGLSGELRTVYNTLNNPNRLHGNPAEAANFGKPMTPQGFGYKGDNVKRELMAEAIRAYMADPNYLKSVAPKTAARIREWWNPNPRAAGSLQFNMLPIGAAAGAGGLSLLPVDHDPFAIAQ